MFCGSHSIFIAFSISVEDRLAHTAHAIGPRYNSVTQQQQCCEDFVCLRVAAVDILRCLLFPILAWIHVSTPESATGAPLLRYFSTLALSLTDGVFPPHATHSFSLCVLCGVFWLSSENVCDRSDKKMASVQTLINLSCNLFFHSSGN